MHAPRILLTFCLLLAATAAALAGQDHLRLLTINVWSGLNYAGVWRQGEYETPEHRSARLESLIDQIRALRPDVIFLQEANPVGPFTHDLARALNYTEIHQVCLGGIKFGPLGIPSNLKEGNAILARPGLRLQKWNEYKLSGGPGIYGDALTVHFDETIGAVIGRIYVDDVPVFLLSTHLYASRPGNYLAGVQRRQKEIKHLLRGLKALPAGSPVIVAGDFNTPLDSPETAPFLNLGFQDVGARDPQDFTWVPGTNRNIREYYDDNKALADTVPRRIDGIFASSAFAPEDVLTAGIALDSVSRDVHPSDHYGVVADLDVGRILAESPRDPATVVDPPRPRRDLLPIAMYDTNTGVGYGLKLFLLHHLRHRESVDLVAFNSTKGERWYRLVYSQPDPALRQGKIYPLAVGLTADYDRWIAASFFGVGNDSRYTDREEYERQTVDLSAAVSRGFTRRIVGQVGVRLKTIKSSGFEAESRLEELTRAVDAGRITYVSVPLQLRYDSRNNFLTPSRGLVFQGDVEIAPHWAANTVHFTRWSGVIQTYSVLFYPQTVLALRGSVQQLVGDELPPQILLPVGSGWTLRGSPLDRYLDKTAAYANAELRFPIIGRLSGIAGMDAGKVWENLQLMDLQDWPSNPVFGLRLNMHTFLVRVDVGLGHETTGLYFNFGHVF